MSKWRIATGSVAVLLISGFVAIKFFPIQIAAAIDKVRNPIAPTQIVTWEKGPNSPPAGERSPNIILIVADDLGINDLTATGTGVANGLVPTPNIDALAKEGAQFSTGYAGISRSITQTIRNRPHSVTCSRTKLARLQRKFVIHLRAT